MVARQIRWSLRRRLYGRSQAFRAARVLASGDLQLIILALLSEKPRHGYEIIKQIEEHSSGTYTPSPGMVYPALTYLEEMGYAASESEGNKKLYSITEAGTAYFNKNRASVEETLEQLARFGRKMADFQKRYAEENEEIDDSATDTRQRNQSRVAASQARISRASQRLEVRALRKIRRVARGAKKSLRHPSSRHRRNPSKKMMTFFPAPTPARFCFLLFLGARDGMEPPRSTVRVGIIDQMFLSLRYHTHAPAAEFCDYAVVREGPSNKRFGVRHVRLILGCFQNASQLALLALLVAFDIVIGEPRIWPIPLP